MSIDFAILGGHYSIARYLYPKLTEKNKILRKAVEYERIGSKFKYRYVNYQMLLEGLLKNV